MKHTMEWAEMTVDDHHIELKSNGQLTIAKSAIQLVTIDAQLLINAARQLIEELAQP